MERESIGTVNAGTVTIAASSKYSEITMFQSVTEHGSHYDYIATAHFNAEQVAWLRDKCNEFLGEPPLTRWQQQVVDGWRQDAQARRTTT